MRDTLITLAGAIVSLVLLVGIMSPPQDQNRYSLPTSEDVGKHGFKAIHAWLNQSGIPTHSLRKPMTRIEQDSLPSSGNLMIVTLPYAREALDSEWMALNRWIESGNTVLVLASIYLIKNMGGGYFDPTSIELMTNDEFFLDYNDVESVDSEFDLDGMRASIDAFRPSMIELHASINHPLFSGAENIESWHTPALYQSKNEVEETQGGYWFVNSETSRLAMRLMHGETKEQTSLWLLPVGDGWVYLSAFPDLIGNHVLKESSNAQWFANLVALSLKGNGVVIFDDYHFGLSDLYDPDAFFSDYRLHNTFLFVVVFWLIYALGRSPRLAPVKKLVVKPATRDFIEATAGFFTRRIKPRVIAYELATRTVDEIGQQTQLSGEGLWSWLNDHPDVKQQDVKLLQRATGYISGRVKLFKLTQSINRIHKVLR